MAEGDLVGPIARRDKGVHQRDHRATGTHGGSSNGVV
jgi:hypothetical protein